MAWRRQRHACVCCGESWIWESLHAHWTLAIVLRLQRNSQLEHAGEQPSGAPLARRRQRHPVCCGESQIWDILLHVRLRRAERSRRALRCGTGEGGGRHCKDPAHARGGPFENQLLRQPGPEPIRVGAQRHAGKCAVVSCVGAIFIVEVAATILALPRPPSSSSLWRARHWRLSDTMGADAPRCVWGGARLCAALATTLAGPVRMHACMRASVPQRPRINGHGGMAASAADDARA
jgi:hypothetical protein